MQPLEPATIDQRSVTKAREDMISAFRKDPKHFMDHGVKSEAEIARISEEEAKFPVWKNDIYQVTVRESGMWTVLSIKRNDRKPVTDWRDKQEIKNQLVGPENEGIELYPAESRLVDSANQYWLFVITDPNVRLPVGFNEGRIVSDLEVGMSKQRPLEKD